MVSSLYKRIDLSIFREPFESYSAKELIETVEKFFGDFATEKKSLTIPIENEWFEVDPLTLIEQECFQHERNNWSEEKTRKEILEAFEEARKNSERLFLLKHGKEGRLKKSANRLLRNIRGRLQTGLNRDYNGLNPL